VEKEYSEEFDQLRRNRMAVSFHKYGPARKNYGEGRVDAANYLMLRFMFPLPGEAFKATDDSGSVGIVGTPINMER